MVVNTEVKEIQFNELLYSEIGDTQVLKPKEGLEGLEQYGNMKNKVAHVVKVVTKLCPWYKASVKKVVVDLKNGKDQVYIKYVTVRMSDVKDVGNKELDRCFEYLRHMLTAKNIDDALYSAWADAMCERRFCIERIGENSAGELTSVTFRFVVTKYNGSWKTDEVEREVGRNRRPKTVEEHAKAEPKKKEDEKPAAKQAPKVERKEKIYGDVETYTIGDTMKL